MGIRRDIGFNTNIAGQIPLTAVTAGGAGDATAINGAYVDCRGLTTMEIWLYISVTGLSSATMTVAGIIQTASDTGGTGLATFAVLDNVVISADTTGTMIKMTVNGAVDPTQIIDELVIPDKSTNLRYLRISLTPDLSAGSGDTAIVGAFFLVGPGRDRT